MIGLKELVGIAERPGVEGIVHFALGPVSVGQAQGGADLIDAYSQFAQQRGIQLRAHGGTGTATDEHLSYPIHLGELLRQYRIRDIIDARQGNRIRGEGENHDGRIGGIDLAIGRIVGKIGRQLSASGVDGSLHIAGGGVDVAIEIEL